MSGGPDTPGALHAPVYATRQPSRWRRNLLLVITVIVGVWLAFAWREMREEALVGTSYAAKMGCVCRFVSQRPLASCEADIEAAGLLGAAGMVSLSDDAPSRTVRASVPLLASQSADFREDRGCRLEPWRN